MSGLAKLLCLLLAGVFLLAAIVQFNDPDPWQWVLIYGLSALTCVGCLLGRSIGALCILVGVVALVWSLSLLPSIIGQVSFAEIFDSISMKTEGVEEAREIGGLWLIAIWNFYLASR